MRHPAAFQEAGSLFYEENVFVLFPAAGTLRCAESYERRAAIRAARVCGMAFSGVDLIRSDRAFTILECNPSPMFSVFEKKTGFDVAGPVADLLVTG